MNKVDKAKGGKNMTVKSIAKSNKIYERISDNDTKVNVIWEEYIKQYEKERDKSKMFKEVKKPCGNGIMKPMCILI